MSAISIAYTGPSGGVLLDASICKDFLVSDVTRGNDNVATSGITERVVEATDVVISFTLPAITVGDSLKAWATFARWAQQGSDFAVGLGGGTAGAQIYNAKLEDKTFAPRRVALGLYAVSFKFRIVPDGDAPVDSGEVLNAFWGLA